MMKKVYSLHSLIIWLNGFITLCSFSDSEASSPSSVQAIPTGAVTITILYDNYPCAKELRTDWGFSCVIEGLEKTLLFDTGGTYPILKSNMDLMEVNPDTIQSVIISHDHSDHIGGLPGFLNRNSDVDVFLLDAFPDGHKEDVKSKNARLKTVTEPVEICDCVRTTGKMGSQIPEQGLVIRTPEGTVVITGCAHPGIVPIVKKAQEITHDEIFFVMGGFHLLRDSQDSIGRIIQEFKKMGVRYVAPTHCTGDKARYLFREAFKENYIELGAGKVLRLGELGMNK